MRGLIAIFKMRFGLILNYRMAAIAGLFTQLFFGFVMVTIFYVFFESNGSLEDSSTLPMTIEQTVTYLWLGQGLLSLLPWNGDREIYAVIRNGDYAYELVRPLDMYNHWLYRILAQRVAATIIRAIPLFILIAFIMPESLKMQGPVNMLGFLMFSLSMITAIILGGTISNIITISILFTIGDGIERLVPAVVTIFSGMVIPLAFFPDWVQPLFRFLPFSGLLDGPYKFYLGIYGSEQLIWVLLHQILWSIVLMMFGRWMLQKASRRVVVQGG